MRFLSMYLRQLSPWERSRDELLGGALRLRLGDACMEGEGGGGGGEPAAEPAEGDDKPEVSADGKPIPVPPYVAKLRSEAAGRRVELRKTQAGLKTATEGLTKATETVTALEAQIKELTELVKGKPGTPADKPKPGSPEAKLLELSEKLKAAEKRVETMEKAGSESTEKARAKTLSTAVKTIVTGLKLNAPDSAAKLLESAAKVKDDGETIVFVVRNAETGEESEVPATAEAVKKHSLLDKVFFPTEGQPGVGSRRGEATITTGLDISKFGDMDYYEKHRKEILSYQRSREPGR